MLLMLSSSVNFVSILCMLYSLVVIIASIRWIKDLYKIKRTNKIK